MIECAAPEVAARAAHLRYVSDEQPGYTRRRRGRHFAYYDTKGALIRDEEELTRVRALVIPPAWTQVWICPASSGHIQATGRDQRGRKQYRYHARWNKLRNETKFERLLSFGEALPRLRACVDRDLRSAGLPRQKILATVVRLLETTLIRVGNDEYARENGSYGLTTLHSDHVEIEGTTIHFHFKGKSGIEHDIDLRDRRLAHIIKACQELPGQELFGYLDEAGDPHSIDSSDVNAYLQEATAAEFTAKDFRTWAGTLCAACALADLGIADSETRKKRNLAQAIRTVATRLGNTPATCRKYYVHPVIVQAYSDGKLLAVETSEDATPADLIAAEKALMKFLRAAL